MTMALLDLPAGPPWPPQLVLHWIETAYRVWSLVGTGMPGPGAVRSVWPAIAAEAPAPARSVRQRPLITRAEWAVAEAVIDGNWLALLPDVADRKILLQTALGRSLRAIAPSIGVSYGTVAKRRDAALRALGQALDGAGGNAVSGPLDMVNKNGHDGRHARVTSTPATPSQRRLPCPPAPRPEAKP